MEKKLRVIINNFACGIRILYLAPLNLILLDKILQNVPH